MKSATGRGKTWAMSSRGAFLRFLLAVVLAAAAAGGHAEAAARQPAPPPAVAPPPPPPPVPYDSALLRLAEIMGSLHFLQQLCSGEGSSGWRDQMTALLDAEQPDDQRRSRLVDRFNRGFEAYRSVYRTCTDSARLAISRYQDEGSTITTDVSTRYGRGG